MNINITGRNVGVTESMKEYARAKIEKLSKFYDRATSARVTMDIDHLEHEVEMVMELTKGTTLVAKTSAADMYAACDLAEEKLSGQLRKWKERLTDHHRGERRTDPDPTRPAPEPKGEREETYEDVIEDMRDGN